MTYVLEETPEKKIGLRVKIGWIFLWLPFRQQPQKRYHDTNTQSTGCHFLEPTKIVAFLFGFPVRHESKLNRRV